ncbi:low molecular weight protein-tyrosine-phosphatase [Sphingopyxis sp. JAI128]|uniref:low molecular weight protein-tyrosine-phosphatase n=1 Tax=Sphingopyxis sp. JAI128 TaxID=2723066 RepID=UPI00160C897E|nr:low molecular weight protein-tyrosine-phosphatase [Sphingopyxis sp. JAI128]MBB6426134.1 protein-tyrosine phosphatase [Sphingopyxis sp. JAI128]
MREDRETAKPAILFLCLGNICRSPLAEGAARAAFAAAGIDATLDSAGTGDWHVGRPPDRRAQAEARRRGTDISALRARQLSAADFYRFDLILAADESNLRDALAIRPADATADLRLMLDLIPGRGGEGVVDPYYGKDDGFAATWADVSAVAAALVAEFSSNG